MASVDRKNVPKLDNRFQIFSMVHSSHSPHSTYFAPILKVASKSVFSHRQQKGKTPKHRNVLVLGGPRSVIAHRFLLSQSIRFVSKFPWVSFVVGWHMSWWASCEARCGEAEILSMGNDSMAKIDIIS